jgi:hypothetical protein
MRWRRLSTCLCKGHSKVRVIDYWVFTPGMIATKSRPEVVKRVYQPMYAKLLAPEDNVLRPNPKNMTPRAVKIFELLFPS